MIVMLANNTGKKVRQLAVDYPGMVGHLFGPGAQRGPVPGFVHAFDNNRFASWKNGTVWDEAQWVKLLEWGRKNPPIFSVVPDASVNGGV